MRDFLLVGGGGFLGAVSRYYLGGWVLHSFPDPRVPLGTLLVNTIGCLFIGLLSGLAEHYHTITPAMRLLLITGVLGGFTTFSAFGYETIFLLRTGYVAWALFNVIASLACGLFAVWLGLRFTL